MNHNVPIYSKKQVYKYSGGRMELSLEPVTSETVWTLFLDEQEIATFLCSPHGIEELAAGFLFSNGLLKSVSELKGVRYLPNEKIIKAEKFAHTQEPVKIPGIMDFEKMEQVCSEPYFLARDLLKVMVALEDRSETFRITGGVHHVGLADGGNLLVSFEDIGRHNAVDKVLGYALLNEIPLTDKCLVLSGRVSLEIVSKAARCKIPLILSRSAAMQAGIDLADKLGITVVGFARNDRFCVYSYPERVIA